MAAPGPLNQLARRANDELMEFSGEIHVPKYMKFFIEQQIVETRHFINVMHEQANSSRNRLAQLNAMISEMEDMNDPDEFYDALFFLRGDKRVEYNMLMAINDDWSLDEDLHFGNAFAGLKLIHTDNDVHSFFVDAKRSGKIHLYITDKQQDLGRYYLRNIVWVEEDVALCCSSSSPFSTRIKRKGGKTTKEGLRKKSNGEQKMVDDEPIGRKAIVNGKAKMVKVEDVGLVQPVGSATKVHRSTTKTNKLPENYCVFEVNYDGVFNEYPLRYEHGKNLTLKLSKSNKMIFSKMLDMLSYKLECEIWGIFVCSPRCSLEEGLTILEGDGDMNKLYDIAKKYGLINLYIAHLPKNLAEYYFEILTLDASDEEVNVADELVLDDNLQYEGLVVDDVGG
ncbi:hypothetical protein Tco_1259599, partial [Tanacetum coccineum]